MYVRIKMHLLVISVLLTYGITSSSELLLAQGNANNFAVKNVRVFDGANVLENTDVLVQDGKIADVGKDLSLPSGISTVDGANQTLLPGFIDSHVHAFDISVLKQSLMFGVTSVLDMFMDPATMKSIKQAMQTDQANKMASLYTAGVLVTAPGGHGTQFGISIPTLSTAEQAQAFIDERIAEGSDYIKIVYDDFAAYNARMNTLSKEVLTAAIKATKNRNKLAVVHIGSLNGAITAIESGADGLVHLYSDGKSNPEFGKIAARHNVFVIPTLTVIESISGSSGAPELLDDDRIKPYLKPADITGITTAFPVTSQDNAYEAAENAARQLHAEKVPVLAGTDAPNPGTSFGVSMHRELKLLVQAGLSPLDALAAATSAPAKSFKLDDRGYIKKGMVADLVLVNGDPTKDILTSRNIVAVWKNGVKADRGEYKTAAAEARAEDERQKAMPVNIGPESGLVSDFESGKIEATFGAGWVISTDSFTGGTSEAEFSVTDGGAEESTKALMVTGEVKPGAPAPWSGIMFSPGRAMMQPVNLSSRKTISFWAKGKEGRYHVMIWAQKSGFVPQMQTFELKTGWNKFSFPFTDFNTDGSDIMGLFIGKSMEQGKFTLYIDNVYIK